MELVSQPFVPQRRSMDCGIAALGFLFHLPYEDVFVAAVRAYPAWCRQGGFSLAHMESTARRLGRRLKRVHFRRVDLETDVGVLGITWNDPKFHGANGHFVVLREGIIICPALPSVWDAEEYLKVQNGRVGTLLVEV